MHKPWLVRLALTLALLFGGFGFADPLISVGGPAIELDVDSDAIRDIADATVDNMIKLLEATGDFICKLFACDGTGGTQPGGGGGQQPAPEVQSVLPIPEDWEKDPRYVRISGRLPIGDATAWLAGLRIARSTFDGDAFLIEFEPFAAGQELAFVTFHQPYVLPEVVQSANRLDAGYVVAAGTYTVEGTSLKIAVTRMR